ncbi:hypothetical protein DFH94DRAFT_686515 [Russula ochroleuca]|uniref:Uncharacterized protein n=1 Tax=Russula ochroleuca TaxID=152965 RepID=A0A9P5JUG6_9AGAM|nr:hypothetical protein DFH94DRAFT_686515 [Russula ochroleuca]
MPTSRRQLRMFGELKIHLSMYLKVPPTSEMMNTIIWIMAKVLSILGIATKEIKQGRMKKFGKKLIGKTDLEDALKRLDKLTQDEARMATAEVLRATHAINDIVASVDNKVTEVVGGVQTIFSQPGKSLT